jgi:hypothetical protein
MVESSAITSKRSAQRPPEITEQMVSQTLDLGLALRAINEQSARHK